MRTTIDWETEPVAPKKVFIDMGCNQVELPLGAGKVPVTVHGEQFELELAHTSVTINGQGSVATEMTDQGLKLVLKASPAAAQRFASSKMANLGGIGILDLDLGDFTRSAFTGTGLFGDRR